MKDFNYDVKLMCNAIRDRPCLWDKTIEAYKDREERRNAWEEIFHILVTEYETMTPEEKRMTGEQIITKWTNIRDTFTKSLKPKCGKPRRKYVLYNHVKFLTKVIPQEPISFQEPEPSIADVDVTFMKQEREKSSTPEPIYASINLSKPDASDDDASDEYCVIENSYSQKKKVKRTSDADTSSYSKKKSKRESAKTRVVESVNDIDFVEVDESDNPRVMNEDEAFFASLLPTVVKYSEDERLEFRLEVLGVMKKIKDGRKWQE